MLIAEVKNDSTAEVEGHFSDVIYMQGCHKDCGYCFNPDLKSFDEGEVIKPWQIFDRLSGFSDVVVITGGEPLYQMDEVMILMRLLRDRGRKIVLETSIYDSYTWALADKILYCIKTFDIDERVLNDIHVWSKVIPVVVVGHPWFDREGFRKILQNVKGDIWVKWYNNQVRGLSDVLHLLKMYKKDLKVLDKICL